MDLFKPIKVETNSNSPVIPSGGGEKVKCLIIGSGPAGYTAAIYAARANLTPVLYEGLEPGGQLTTTTEVENYPGFPDRITGPIMMDNFKKQAQKFATDIRYGIATAVDFSKRPFKVVIDENKLIEAQVVIIATGATAMYLGLESEEKFKGSGVSACATCDGFFYKGMDVAVIGGGDTACEEASYLAGLCRKVYLIVRKNYLRASKAMQHRVLNTRNIEVLFEHTTKEITGSNVVEGLILNNKKGEEVKLNIAGYFVAIGHKPNSDIFKPWIETNETGYIKTVPGTSRTNILGIFACGDVQDPTYRQAVTAAGSGCTAAIDAERFLGEHGNV
jgi:thioredoxin reductase (NADPH)